MVLWILLGSIGLGLVLVWFGLRGKRLNDHPVCRQCRFDLSGSPEGTVTCPECGAGLKRPGSTRIGQRRKRTVCIGLGAVLVGLPAAALATTAYAMLTGADVHKYMPVGFLLWEARHADAARSKAVAAELLARYNGKKLEEEQVTRVMECALDVQGDERLPWATEWGDLIETGRSDGKLSEADQARFRVQSAVVALKPRPRVRIGDPAPLVISLKEARIGSSTALQSQVIFKSATVDGKPMKQARVKAPGGFATTFTSPMLGWFQLFGASNRMWGGQAYGQAALLLDLPKDLEAGPKQIQISVYIVTKPQSTRSSFSFSTGAPRKNDPDARLVERTVSVLVDPADVKGVELVQPSADVKEKMRRMAEASDLRVQVFDQGGVFSVVGPSGPIGSASMTFSIDGRPMEGAFDVLWRSGEREWPIGTLTTGTGADPNGYTLGPGMDAQRYVYGQVQGFDADTVDVVLRPSEKAAARTIDLTRIYGEEIVAKDVHVSVMTQDGTGTVVSVKPSKAKPTSLWLSLQRLVTGR
jgi:hypothetical protein